jgi:hypothetical protein
MTVGKIVEPENLKHMAHIVDGKVVNVSLWDGESDWTPAEEIVEIPEGVTAGIGWDYVDGDFVDNRPVEIYPEDVTPNATN